MEEYLRLEAGYHIIRAIRGEPDKDGFMKKHKEATRATLAELIEMSKAYDKVLDDYVKKEPPMEKGDKFHLYTTGVLADAEQKPGKAYKGYAVTMPMLPGSTAVFDEEGDLTIMLEMLQGMLAKDDYDFNIFKPSPNLVKLINDQGRGAGLGSPQTLPGLMPVEEKEKFLASKIAKDFFKASEVINNQSLAKGGFGDSAVDKKIKKELEDEGYFKELSPRQQYQNMLTHAQAAYLYYTEIYSLWREYGIKTKFDQQMVDLYYNSAEDFVEYADYIRDALKNMPMTKQEELEVYRKKAEQGDIEAAKIVRKAAQAYRRELAQDEENNREKIKELQVLARQMLNTIRRARG